MSIRASRILRSSTWSNGSGKSGSQRCRTRYDFHSQLAGFLESLPIVHQVNRLQGSTWDTVLIRALYFAEHLNRFEVAVQGLASGSNAAAQLGYGHARLLLEVHLFP